MPDPAAHDLTPPRWVHAWLRRGWSADHDGRDASAAFDALAGSNTRDWLRDNLDLLLVNLTGKMVATLEALLEADGGVAPVSRSDISAHLDDEVDAGNLVKRLHGIERLLDECPPVPGVFPPTRIRLLVTNRGADCAPGAAAGRWVLRSRTAPQYYRLGVDHRHDGTWRWGLATPYHRATNLLPRLDPFVPRPDIAARIRSAFHTGRLVTLVGVGGVGKTRIAEHYSLGRLRCFRVDGAGAWRVDLGRATDLAEVVERLTAALALGRQVDGDDPQRVASALARRGPTLLLLDGLERVIDPVAAVAAPCLRRAPSLRILATSREPLGIPGEVVIEVPVMDRAEALALFTLRSNATERGAGTEDDPRVVAELVDRLDRLPLAIELAAARAASMAPREILSRMDKRFRLLGGVGGAGGPATLRATLDWSWELLSAEERSALAQLSVFEGGFTLEAAEATVATDGEWVADLVAALVHKSLVRRVASDRYDLLYTVQAYASEKLEHVEDVHARHGAYYARFGTPEALVDLDAGGGVARRHALRRDLDNFVSAVARAATGGDASVAAHNALAAWATLSLTGPADATVHHLEAAAACFDRATGEPDPRLFGWLLLALSGSLRELGRATEAADHLAAVVAHAKATADPRLEANALDAMARLTKDRGRVEDARRLGEAALALHRAGGDAHGEGTTLGRLGNLEMEQGRLAEAEALYRGALAGHRAVGNRRGEANAVGNIGIVLALQGRNEEAEAMYRAALALHREVGNRRAEGIALGNLGNVHEERGELDAAQTLFEAALAVHRGVGNRRAEGGVLDSLAAVHQARGDLGAAEELLERALAIQRDVGDRRWEGIVLGHLGELYRRAGQRARSRQALEGAIALCRETRTTGSTGVFLGCLAELDADEGARPASDRAMAEAVAMVVRGGPPVDLGLLRCRQARIALGRGDRGVARAHLEQAAAIADQVGAGRASSLARAIAELHARLSVVADEAVEERIGEVHPGHVHVADARHVPVGHDPDQ